jgi:hypothetical protein
VPVVMALPNPHSSLSSISLSRSRGRLKTPSTASQPHQVVAVPHSSSSPPSCDESSNAANVPITPTATKPQPDRTKILPPTSPRAERVEASQADMEGSPASGTWLDIP